MPLTSTQKTRLRSLGHALKPVVTIGTAGLSDSVLAEMESSLLHHELIKIKVNVGDRNARDQVINRFCAGTRAELIQRVGNVALIFRRNPGAPKVRLD